MITIIVLLAIMIVLALILAIVLIGGVVFSPIALILLLMFSLDLFIIKRLFEKRKK